MTDLKADKYDTAFIVVLTDRLGYKDVSVNYPPLKAGGLVPAS